MPVNANPDYVVAEAEYHKAQTLEQKVRALEKMISLAPKHKSSENLVANLKTRYKKFKKQLEVSKKKGKSSKVGIRKEDMQAIILGFVGVGKSSLLKLLTNTNPEISFEGNLKNDARFLDARNSLEFRHEKPTTKFPIVGMMPYSGTYIQLVENPAWKSEFYDKGIPHTADTLVILVDKLEQIKEILDELNEQTHPGKKLIVFNKIDLLSEDEKRKIESRLRSKKYNFTMISTRTEEGVEEFKEKLFQTFGKIRVYTKEPGKEKSSRPVILNPESTIKQLAEKILGGFSKNIKETKIWGPSSKFAGQKVGIAHRLKDRDTVEFKTK